MSYRLVVFYPLDPRGTKVGGIETHIRLILENFPSDFAVLFIGVDEIGDRALRVAAPLRLGSRSVDFCPVARIPADRINLAAASIWQSTTFRFVVGALRSVPYLRALLRGRSASADLQRFEAALLPRLLGIPAVQMVHGEGSKTDKMDSLIKKLWFLHALNERLALHLATRVLCVNENIIRRIRREFGAVADKAELLTVSVDTRVFAPRPFDLADGIFRVIFAGRLDEFKDPPLMFRCFAELQSRLSGRFEFHYVGTSDPSRFEEFSTIEGCTIRHGFQTPAGVSAIAAKCHAGVLTSFFEGMPCFLLEVLSVGRPFVAIRLPQFDPLIVDGTSGHLIERGADPSVTAGALADGFARLWRAILSGSITPEAVHAMIAPYSVENQMSRLFEIHRQLQRPALQAAASSRSTTCS